MLEKRFTPEDTEHTAAAAGRNRRSPDRIDIETLDRCILRIEHLEHRDQPRDREQVTIAVPDIQQLQLAL